MKKQLLLFTFIIAAGPHASGQMLTFGVKGGVPLLDPTTHGDESRPFIIGPSIEVRLPANFAVEASALYQRIGNTTSFISSGPGVVLLPQQSLTTFNSRLRGNSWEFPLFGKYYFRSRKEAWQPFVGTGWAFRATGLHYAFSETTRDSSGITQALSFRQNFRAPLGVGAVFGAGVRYRMGRCAFLPEVRYTRWGGPANQTRPSEARLLLGFTF